MSSIEEKAIYNQDIRQIELTYEGHCCIDLEEVFEDDDTNPFAESKVKQWWVKYGRLYVELDDGSMIEKDVTSCVSDAYDNLDTKWPSGIMVQDKKGNWHNLVGRETLWRDVP